MSPIRVGLIGLSTASSNMSPGAWAISAHLPLLANSPNYEIVALANSTVQSAQASIDYHKLGPHVKAYGNSEDLAQDPNVDLVVVSVKVQHHYALTKPALLAGKDVFVEWPLAATLAQAEELTKLAEAKGVKTIVGLQARADPLVLKIRELLESGKIGKVVSTAVTGTLISFKPGEWLADATYYLDINSGGNSLTIAFGHFVDTFNLLLGEFTHLSSTLKTQIPTLRLIDASGKVTNPSYTTTSPDQILVQGILSSGATASLAFRQSVAADSKGLHWLITGAEGEIEITTPEMGWSVGSPGSTLKVRRSSDGAAEDVSFEVEEDEVVKGVQFPGTNTAREYEAWRKGERVAFADFGDALVTHKVIEAIRKSDKERKEVTL